MFALIPQVNELRDRDEILFYMRDGEKFTRSWKDDYIGRLIVKDLEHSYEEPYEAFGEVEKGEILIIQNWVWRQIR